MSRRDGLPQSKRGSPLHYLLAEEGVAIMNVTVVTLCVVDVTTRARAPTPSDHCLAHLRGPGGLYTLALFSLNEPAHAIKARILAFYGRAPRDDTICTLLHQTKGLTSETLHSRGVREGELITLHWLL